MVVKRPRPGTQIYACGDISTWPDEADVAVTRTEERTFELSFVQNGLAWQLVHHDIGPMYVTERWQGRVLAGV